MHGVTTSSAGEWEQSWHKIDISLLVIVILYLLMLLVRNGHVLETTNNGVTSNDLALYSASASVANYFQDFLCYSGKKSRPLGKKVLILK